MYLLWNFLLTVQSCQQVLFCSDLIVSIKEKLVSLIPFLKHRRFFSCSLLGLTALTSNKSAILTTAYSDAASLPIL